MSILETPFSLPILADVTVTKPHCTVLHYLDKLRSLRQPQLDGVGLPFEVHEADEGERDGQERAGYGQHRISGY